MMLGAGWGALALALWLATGPEPARLPRELSIAIEGCSDELTARLPALVRLEVDVLMRERGERRALPETIAVRCAGGAAPVVVEVALAGARREARVALGGLAAEHRARALALALAELVDALAALPPAPAAAEASVGSNAPRPPETPDPALLRAERPVYLPGTRPPAVLVGATAAWLGKPAALLFGARLAYQHRPFQLRPSPVMPMLSLGGSAGDARSSAGPVAARIIAAGAHALVGAPLGWFRVEGGPGFRFGWAHLAGQPPAGAALEGRSVTGWWGGPELCLRATTSTAMQGGVRPAVDVSAGWVVLPLRGLVDGATTAYAIQGPWLSVALQLALELR